MALNAKNQRDWIEQQKREQKFIQDQERADEAAYAQQTETITRMRGMLEDEANQKKANALKQMQEENKRLAQAKRDAESNWRADQERMNQAEIAKTNNSDIMTENAMTTKSNLAEHRYVPYHFKGLRPDQVEDINATRAQQVRENKQLRQDERNEEAAWAAQQAANTQMMLQNEIDMRNRYSDCNQGQKGTHKVDRVAKDERWPNYYKDLDALPDVQKDLDQKARVSFAM